MPIWIAVRTSTGCRLSRLAHSAAMISGGRSRPRFAAFGFGGDVAAAEREVAGPSPAATCPGRVSPRARIPDSTARVSRQMTLRW